MGANSNHLGLVLSGGGARAAYQAGVLKGIATILKESSTEGHPSPFSIITGVSAGAINAAYLAAQAEDFERATEKLIHIWTSLRPDDIFKTDAWSLLRIGTRWLYDLFLGGVHRHPAATSLLNTSPLHHLLDREIDYYAIRKNLQHQNLSALAITAMDYTSSDSTTFVEALDAKGWTRARRHAEPTQIGTSHIMASAALPLIFPPVKIGDRFFGDGALRNMAPLSPAIRLGARRLLVVSVKKATIGVLPHDPINFRPSAAKIVSVIMNALLLDNTEHDMERMLRANKTLNMIPEEHRHQLDMKPLDCVWLRPSEDLGQIARKHTKHLPQLIRYFLRGLGSEAHASEITSYLLFDPGYCSELIDLGLKDALTQRPRIMSILGSG